jgi:Uma2 family endonuclease
MAAPRRSQDIPAVPPLETGYRLTRDEFERRYDAMPDLKKAELIEGVVYVGSRVRLNRHGRPHAQLITWLGAYEASTPGVQAALGASVRLDLDNEPQPDGLLLIEPACGGQVHISADDYVEGAPELAAEVAASSVSIELNTKLQVYRRNGVREYLVWRVAERALDWFVLRQGQYERLALSPAGFYQSEAFPGLWLDPAALTRFDVSRVLEVLQQGIASPEHAAFVARLQGATVTKR